MAELAKPHHLLISALEQCNLPQIEILSSNTSLRKFTPDQLVEVVIKALDLKNAKVADHVVAKITSDDISINALTALILKALNVDRRDIANRFCTPEILLLLTDDELHTILEKAKEKKDTYLIERIHQISDI